MDADFKVDRGAAVSGGQMHAVDITVMALAEDYTVERLVKAQINLHRVLLAFDVEGNDFGHVREIRGPVLHDT